MDDGTPIEIANDDPLWNQAIQDVNAWRGACLQHFSAAEAAVTETLLLLKAIPGRGEAVRLRHLIGQRFDDLSKLIEADGAFAKEGKAAAKALLDLRTLEGLRSFLAHGQAKIALERTGKWIVILRHVSIRGQQAERLMLLFEQAEAEERHVDLKRKARSCALFSAIFGEPLRAERAAPAMPDRALGFALSLGFPSLSPFG